ncbi:MAG: endonuclease III [Bacteroidia bacterium]|nr:endonuclease III [Bacteroidia bacterium]MCZ2277591.1 endonuclease III [Bacteroidia bacterium]
MTIKERYARVLSFFEESMPFPETELRYDTPFQLLVAVILSAQCTDKRVNMVTAGLFEAFPDARSMASVSADDIFPFIKSISYPNNKAKHLALMSRMLVEEFNCIVPATVEQLLRLPGVGRKTANVIASVIYNKSAMAVDTHVFRVSQRIGLVRKAKTPLEVEKQLIKHIPEKLIPKAHHWLILHGRYICTARNPRCHECGLRAYCNYYQYRIRSKQKTTSLKV